jgi:hypothetical protein
LERAIRRLGLEKEERKRRRRRRRQKSKIQKKRKERKKNVTSDTPDDTTKLEGQIQQKLLKLKKDGQILEKDYNQIRPSGSIPASSTPQVKAHKPTKDFPVRNIISHRGCPQEALASYLIPLLRPLLKDSPFTCKNSTEFINKIRNVKLNQNEILISYDAEALFPSIPLQDAFLHIYELLKNDVT